MNISKTGKEYMVMSKLVERTPCSCRRAGVKASVLEWIFNTTKMFVYLWLTTITELGKAFHQRVPNVRQTFQVLFCHYVFTFTLEQNEQTDDWPVRWLPDIFQLIISHKRFWNLNGKPVYSQQLHVSCDMLFRMLPCCCHVIIFIMIEANVCWPKFMLHCQGWRVGLLRMTWP